MSATSTKLIAIAIVALLVGTGAGYWYGSQSSAGKTAADVQAAVQAANAAWQAKMKESKTLRIGIVSIGISLDPAYCWAGDPQQLILLNVYDTLISMKGNNYGVIYPNLATRWTISSDGLQYTFYMRKGVKFASGNEVNAKAAHYTYWRFMKLNLGPAWLFTQCLNVNNTDSVKVIDDYTIQFNLKRPFPPFLSILAEMNGAVMDPAEVEAHGGVSQKSVDWFSEHSSNAGSGPYILDHWTREVEVVLKRNPKYWGGVDNKQPWFDEIIIKEIKESADQKMMLERGDIDIAYNLTPDMWIELKDNPKYQLDEIRVDRYFYLTMNCKQTNSPFRDLNVRQAVKCALNRDELMKLARGFAVAQASPQLANYPGYDPELLRSPYSAFNLEKAKQHMAASKYPNGFKTGILVSKTVSYGINLEELALLVKQQLAKINIDLDLVVHAPATALKLFRGAEYEGVAIFTWGVDYFDGQNTADIHWTVEGAVVKRAGFDPSIHSYLLETNKLCEQAMLATDIKQRDALYKAAGKIDNEFGPFYYMWQAVGYYVRRSTVRGGMPPFPGDRLSALYGFEIKDMWKEIK